MGEKNLFTETTVTVFTLRRRTVCQLVTLCALLCGSTNIKMRSETTPQPTVEIYSSTLTKHACPVLGVLQSPGGIFFFTLWRLPIALPIARDYGSCRRAAA